KILKSKKPFISEELFLVRMTGIEPARREALDPKFVTLFLLFSNPLIISYYFILNHTNLSKMILVLILALAYLIYPKILPTHNQNGT
ncbi:MAG: hypothetical protein WBA41_04535, partial [Rivularia sp. (in: cyanobacteria)]